MRTKNKGQQTRQTILTTAFHLFTANGYHATSMRHIAENAGIVPAAIYNHFKRKEDIFIAVIETYHPFLSILPALAHIEGDDIETLVRQVAEKFEAVLGENAGILNLLFIEMIEFKGQHALQMFEKHGTAVQSFAQRLMQANGNLRPISPPHLFQSLLSLLVGQAIMNQLTQGVTHPLLATGSKNAGIDIFLHGILLQPSTTL